jgi:NodT family efflux transporter outer membrane factor (OMF) lipoprotein
MDGFNLSRFESRTCSAFSCTQLQSRTSKRTVSPLLSFVLKAGTLLVFVLTTSGCASLSNWIRNGFKVGPNHTPPAAPVAEAWIDQADSRVKNASVQDYAWWTVFNDPTLNRLIDTAYHQNLDLQTAGTRILEARAQRHIAAGNLFPQSQAAVAGLAHAQFGPNLGLPLPHTLNIWADGFNASWEIDFWGRYRRSIEAADANLQASTERYGEALVMVLSEVAANYVQMRTFEQRLQYAKENVAIQKKSLELAVARFEQGAGTELDERQARSNLALTESLIPPLEAGRRVACNRLCILLGMPVTELASQIEPASIPNAPPEVAVGLPADLLCRRPDIRRAERQVAAQSAQIGIAESDLYPRLGVSGFIGYAADDLGDLFSSKNFTSFIIPSLQWNILNYGRIINNVATQEARLQATTLQYQQTVLTAGREVEDGLVQFIQAQQQAKHLEDAVSQAERSVELVVKQFEGGVTDFNRVFTTQAQLVIQQDQLATARGNIALNLIQVYRAMGGGWESIAEGHGMPNLANSVDAEAIPQSPATID